MEIFGIDVSHHQPNLNYSAMKADGIDFAFIKCSEGSTFLDDEFVSNLSKANAAGMICAAYHYVRSNASALSQAQNVRRIVPSWLPVIPDVEANSGGVQLTRDFVQELRNLGYTVPLTYIPRWYWQQIGSPSLVGLPPLWSSRYPDNVVDDYRNEWADVPSGYWNGYGGLEVAVLQFSSSSRVAGYAPLDTNAYRGTIQGFKALMGQTVQTVSAPEEDDMAKTFYVKGDATGEMGNYAPPGYEHTKWGDCVFLVEATVTGMQRRHIQADELRAAAATPTTHQQAWVDSIPGAGGQPCKLFPWVNSSGGNV